MIRTGDVVIEKQEGLNSSRKILIIYDDLGENSEYCYALPLEDAGNPILPMQFPKENLSKI